MYVRCVLCNAVCVIAVPYWRPNSRPVDKQVDEDDSVEFECQADGSPKPNITWYINGQSVDSESIT